MGIRAKFIMLMAVMGLLAVGGLGYGSYTFSLQNAMEEAESKGEIIFSYILSAGKQIKETQRPLLLQLVEKDRFYPELMSSFRFTRDVTGYFTERLPGYRFKQASLNPLVPSNRADKDEITIINRFEKKPGLKKQEGRLFKGGEEFFYLARPVRVETDCLLCHGDPLDAPKDQVEIYGTKTGYHWTRGKTIAAQVVYIPMKHAMDAAKRSTMIIFGTGAAALLLGLLCISIFLDRVVVAPILRLCTRTVDISLGKNIDESVVPRSKDEVGILAKAIERLRVSTVKMLRRAK